MYVNDKKALQIKLWNDVLKKTHLEKYEGKYYCRLVCMYVTCIYNAHLSPKGYPGANLSYHGDQGRTRTRLGPKKQKSFQLPLKTRQGVWMSELGG